MNGVQSLLTLLLSLRVLHERKLVILDPVGASWANIGANYHAQTLSLSTI